MKFESEHKRLSEKLKDLKEIIGGMNSDVVMLINFSAQIENGLKKKENFSKKQLSLMEKKLNRIIKTYFKKKQR